MILNKPNYYYYIFLCYTLSDQLIATVSDDLFHNSKNSFFRHPILQFHLFIVLLVSIFYFLCKND